MGERYGELTSTALIGWMKPVKVQRRRRRRSTVEEEDAVAILGIGVSQRSLALLRWCCCLL